MSRGYIDRTPKLCRGSLERPAFALITQGFCSVCKIAFKLTDGGGITRHYKDGRTMTTARRMGALR